MATHQVDEFYLHIQFSDMISEIKRGEISEYLLKQGYSRFEFQFGDELIIDDIESESCGDNLEILINKMVK